MLTGNETIDNYREVTAAERQSIEAQDAKWTEPSQDLIDRAEAAGVVYNRTTGYFELNGLTDITASEMEDIILFGKATFVTPECNNMGVSGNTHIRTNWLQYGSDAVSKQPVVTNSFYNQQLMEVLRMPNDRTYTVAADAYTNFAHKNPKLHTILGYIRMDKANGSQTMFAGATALRDVNLLGIKSNIVIKDSPLLSVASARCMVANAANTDPISIEVHPDVYAKLSNTDAAAYVPANMLINSKSIELIAEPDQNTIGVHVFFDQKIIVRKGDKLTVSVGSIDVLAGDPTAFEAYLYDKDSGGQYGMRVKFTKDNPYATMEVSKNATVGAIVLYDGVYNLTGGNRIRYNNVMLAYGDEPKEWTPALSEIADAEMREKAEWASVMQMARARQISFITSE